MQYLSSGHKNLYSYLGLKVTMDGNPSPQTLSMSKSIDMGHQLSELRQLKTRNMKN